MLDENADHSQLLADSAADLLAILATYMRDDHTNQSPHSLSVAQAKSVGGLAEPAGEAVVQVLLIVTDPGDVAVGA